MREAETEATRPAGVSVTPMHPADENCGVSRSRETQRSGRVWVCGPGTQDTGARVIPFQAEPSACPSAEPVSETKEVHPCQRLNLMADSEKNLEGAVLAPHTGGAKHGTSERGKEG